LHVGAPWTQSPIGAEPAKSVLMLAVVNRSGGCWLNAAV
jgi:hypothetical protein